MRFLIATIVLTLCLSSVMAEVEIKISQYQSITNLKPEWTDSRMDRTYVHFRCQIESTNETCSFLPSHLYCDERNGCKGSVVPGTRLRSMNITTIPTHGVPMAKLLERYPNLSYTHGLRVYEIDYVLEFDDQYVPCSNEQMAWDRYFMTLYVSKLAIVIGLFILDNGSFLNRMNFTVAFIILSICSVLWLLVDTMIPLPACASTGPMYLH